jgi:hypothetical protein
MLARRSLLAAAPLGPAEFAAFQRAEVEHWAALVELTGIRME